MTSYKDFYYDVLNFELQQEPDPSDVSTNSYRILPKDQAVRYINRALMKLYSVNKAKFAREYLYTFDSDTNTLSVPNDVLTINAYQDSVTGVWITPRSHTTNSKIKLIGTNELYNSEGWLEDDTILLYVVGMPVMPADNTDIDATNTDTIDFAQEYLDLLMLEVKKAVYARINKPLSPYDYGEYMTRLMQFKKEPPKILKSTRIAFNGAGLGR